jgi:hypothetical protein
MAEQDDLVKRLVASLAEDPAYEVRGELETSPCGPVKWVKYTDPDGREHYLRWSWSPSEVQADLRE